MSKKYILTLVSSFALSALFSCDDKNSNKKSTNDSTVVNMNEKNTTESSTSDIIGGTYKFGGETDQSAVGSIIVYPLSSQSAMFYLEVNKGGPSFNMGIMLGEMKLNGNVGTYDAKQSGDEFNCKLTFKFSNKQVVVATEDGHGECGFGNAVYADNTYKLTDAAVPTYFVNMEGDTILFKGLTAEKYRNR